MVQIMSVYDILLDYLEEVHKERMAKINTEIEEYKQKHPHATTKQIENLEQTLYWRAQREAAIEANVLQTGIFYKKPEPKPFLIEIMTTKIPIWVIFVITTYLVLTFCFIF